MLVRFVRGFHRAQRWMATASAAAIAAVIAPAFPEIDAAIRVRAIERYIMQGTWTTDPVLTRTGYETLQDILLTGGFIRRRHPFEALVDTTIAAEAVAG